MTNKTNFITQLVEDVLHKQNPKKTFYIKPLKHWLISLLLGFLILISFVGWSVAVYVYNRQIDKHLSSEEVSIMPIYNAAKVEEAIEYFNERDRTLQSLHERNGYIKNTNTTNISEVVNTEAQNKDEINEYLIGEPEAVVIYPELIGNTSSTSQNTIISPQPQFNVVGE